MALPRGLPQVSDTGKLLGALEYNVVDATKKLVATAATGTPATGLFHSTVVNRKSIPDITKDLGVRMGIERIPVQSIYQLQDEFGPNGEPVYAALNDDRGLIRIVGGCDATVLGQGQYIRVYNSGLDYIEISFYGTGVNILLTQPGAVQQAVYSVDGGSESSNFITNMSGVIAGRFYNSNAVQPVVSGLPIGTHTVKIRVLNSSVAFLHFHGFEILNEQLLITTANTNSNTSLTNVASTAGLKVGMDIAGAGIPANTTITAISGSTITMSAAATATATGVTVRFGTNFIKVNPGTSYINGVAETLASQSTFAHNSGFESITRDGASVVSLGSKGGRVVVYQKEDGSIAKAATAVNTSQANLASANHTYEEVIRTYHFREFGAGRTDDFSRFTGANANLAFTLDDGTTTLVGSNIDITVAAVGAVTNIEQIWPDASDFFTLTFVGTGLDIACLTDSSTRTSNVTVDGVSIGSISKTANTAPEIKKIVSGLPYGTHTVKIQAAGGAGLGAYKFITYGPKKPTVPSGAVELADYNVMANYTASASASLGNVAQGIVRKMGSREFVYTGTWTASSISPTSQESGLIVETVTPGSTFRYTFFGTGVEWTGYFNNIAVNTSVTVDGASNLSAFTSALLQPGAGVTWNSAAGTLTGTSSVAGKMRLQISGLSLGLHTIVITQNTTTFGVYADTLDIITPVHSPKSSLYGDLQNALTVGSCAISDNRVTTTSVNTNSIKPKAWAQAVGVASGPTTTSTIAIPMPDMSTTVKTSGSRVLISYSTSVSNSSANNTTRTAIYVNGILLNSEKTATSASNGSDETNSDTQIIFLPAGTHKIDVYWWCGGGTSTASGTRRNLIVAEL